MGRHDEKDRKMLANPNAWPCWPRLPLKRIRNGNFEPGIVYDDADLKAGKVTVHVEFMAGRPKKDEQDIKKYEYGSIAAMQEAGWEVD